jgi:hypothetical protein
MDKQNKTKSKIPSCVEEINEFIYTYLHLDEKDNFQLLHSELIRPHGINEFQIFGRFRGERITTSDNDVKFLVQEVDFKLVNLIEEGAEFFYKIKGACFEREEKNDNINCYIEIEESKGNSKNLDFISRQLFVFEKGEMIDFHIAGRIKGVFRNGVPCLTKIHF